MISTGMSKGRLRGRLRQKLIQSGTPSPQATAVAKVIMTTPDFTVRAWDANHFSPRQTTTCPARGLGPGAQQQADHDIAYALHGKVVKRVRAGALRAPCGNLHRRMRQFPFRPVPAGDYSIYLAPGRIAVILAARPPSRQRTGFEQ